MRYTKSIKSIKGFSLPLSGIVSSIITGIIINNYLLNLEFFMLILLSVIIVLCLFLFIFFILHYIIKVFNNFSLIYYNKEEIIEEGKKLIDMILKGNNKKLDSLSHKEDNIVKRIALKCLYSYLCESD